MLQDQILVLTNTDGQIHDTVQYMLNTLRNSRTKAALVFVIGALSRLDVIASIASSVG